jgi:hypothetical protein
MSLNDFAVQLYLTLLSIAAAPILLSWVLRRIAGKHAPEYPVAQARAEDDDFWQEHDEWWWFWARRDDEV